MDISLVGSYIPDKAVLDCHFWHHFDFPDPLPLPFCNFFRACNFWQNSTWAASTCCFLLASSTTITIAFLKLFCAFRRYGEGRPNHCKGSTFTAGELLLELLLSDTFMSSLLLPRRCLSEDAVLLSWGCLSWRCHPFWDLQTGVSHAFVKFKQPT